MQPIAPAPPRHNTSSEFVNDNHFAITDNILLVEMIERVRLKRLLDAMQQFHIAWVIKIADAGKSLCNLNTEFSKRCRMLLLVNVIEQIRILFQIHIAIGPLNL